MCLADVLGMWWYCSNRREAAAGQTIVSLELQLPGLLAGHPVEQLHDSWLAAD
jgi:hypothetical protein